MKGEESLFEQFGRQLREARESRQRSIDEIAERTRINRRYIEAIESGDLPSLPPGPYTRAFLREYARVVGLTVPPELAEISNAIESSANVSIRKISTPRPASSKDSPESNGVAKRVTSAPPASTPQPLNAAFKATKDTARIANKAAKTAARSAVRTTETVIKRVESGAKDAVDVITSKSLWEEAEVVRRERRGLAPLPDQTDKPASAQLSRAADDLDIRDIRSRIIEAESSNPTAVQREVEPPTTTLAESSSSFASPIQFEPSKLYGDETPTEGAKEEAERGYARGERKGRMPRMGLLSTTNLVILGIVVLFAAVIALALHQNTKQETPEVLPTAQPEIATEKPAPTESKATPVPATQPAAIPTIGANDSLRFVLKAHSAVWVSIGPDSRPAFRGMLKAGEVRSFAAHDKFIVNLGNQREVDMTFDGQGLSHLPTIANSGIVVRDLELTRDRISLAGKPVALSNTASTSTTTPVPHAATPSSNPGGIQSSRTETHAKASSATKVATSSSVKNNALKKASDVKPTALKPGTSKPGTSKPGVSKLANSKSTASKPAGSKPPAATKSRKPSHTKPFKSTIPTIDPVAPRP